MCLDDILTAAYLVKEASKRSSEDTENVALNMWRSKIGLQVTHTFLTDHRRNLRSYLWDNWNAYWGNWNSLVSWYPRTTVYSWKIYWVCSTQNRCPTVSPSNYLSSTQPSQAAHSFHNEDKYIKNIAEKLLLWKNGCYTMLDTNDRIRKIGISRIHRQCVRGCAGRHTQGLVVSAHCIILMTLVC